jgi:hypothetical protein
LNWQEEETALADAVSVIADFSSPRGKSRGFGGMVLVGR